MVARKKLGCWHLQGAKLLYYDSRADVLLLDIPGQVPSSFKTFRVGYDATAAPPRRAVGIHHPNGNVKRISYANDTCAHMLLGLGFRLQCDIALPRRAVATSTAT